MEQKLLIETDSHGVDLLLYDVDDIHDALDLEAYEEQLASTYANIYLYLVNEDYEEGCNLNEKELVSTIGGRLFDMDYVYEHRLHLASIFDMYDADTSSLACYLLDEKGDIKEEYISVFSNNIYYLDRIEVEEKFRGQGYAKFLLHNLPKILTYISKINIGLMVVQAQPFDRINQRQVMDYENKARKERLIQLYESCEFTRIDHSNYLIRLYE